MANRKYWTNRKNLQKKKKVSSKDLSGQAKAACLQIFQMRKKRQGREREQDGMRNEHTKSGLILLLRPGMLAFKESGLKVILVVLGRQLN